MKIDTFISNLCKERDRQKSHKNAWQIDVFDDSRTVCLHRRDFDLWPENVISSSFSGTSTATKLQIGESQAVCKILWKQREKVHFSPYGFDLWSSEPRVSFSLSLLHRSCKCGQILTSSLWHIVHKLLVCDHALHGHDPLPPLYWLSDHLMFLLCSTAGFVYIMC